MDLTASFDPRVVAAATVTLVGGAVATWRSISRGRQTDRMIAAIMLSEARNTLRSKALLQMHLIRFESDPNPANRERAADIYQEMLEEMTELPSSEIE